MDDEDRARLVASDVPRHEDPDGASPIVPHDQPFHGSIIDWGRFWALVVSGIVLGIAYLVSRALGG